LRHGLVLLAGIGGRFAPLRRLKASAARRVNRPGRLETVLQNKASRGRFLREASYFLHEARQSAPASPPISISLCAHESEQWTMIARVGRSSRGDIGLAAFIAVLKIAPAQSIGAWPKRLKI
jgi:hypothetical protein